MPTGLLNKPKSKAPRYTAQAEAAESQQTGITAKGWAANGVPSAWQKQKVVVISLVMEKPK